MSKKDKFIFTFFTVCLCVVVLTVSFAAIANAGAKPDITMTPSYDYLTVQGLDNCAPVYISDSNNTGRLYCLPVRP